MSVMRAAVDCLAALLGLFGVCRGFNFDLKSVDVIASGYDNDYFGYSLLLQRGSVLVGAPKSNSTFPNHYKIKEPGALYRCEIGGPRSCGQFIIDREGNTEHRENDFMYFYKNRKDGALLGAAVDGGEDEGDAVVVCSPRWINDRIDRNGQHYLANGMCYLIDHSRYLNATAKKIMPLLKSGNQGYTINNQALYYYAMGEVGMSVEYHGKEGELLLGAPGVLSWKGTVVRSFLGQKGGPSPPDVPNPLHISGLKDGEDNSYLGYSITSGKFDRKYSNKWYVAGAPRAEGLNGLVLLFEFNNEWLLHRKLMGEQIGSYFGSALLSVDLAGKGEDDLLVGAPTYYIDTWDEGCVYLYMNNGMGDFHSPTKIFGSKQAGARFGSAISKLGDINQDSFQDVAISAPYEDGQGVVYIFLGDENGLKPEFSQKISAKSIEPSLRGFGFSVSKGVDIDNNLYKDVAVGAYQSGHVVVVKSRPTIKYSATLTPSVKELPVDATKFNLTYCLRYASPTKSVKMVDTYIEIVKDSRTINNNNVVQSVTLTEGKDFCASTEIALKVSNLDYTKPFTVEMNYAIIESQQQGFCSTCPVTDPSESKSAILNVPFANGCGEDNICTPDLQISANFEDNLSDFVIGTLTTVKLHVRIENKNEPAYLCQVLMKLPADVEIAQISSRCEFKENRLYRCLVDNVLKSNSYKELVFDLDLKKVNPLEKGLTLNLTTNSQGEEVNLDDNSVALSLAYKLENSIEMSSVSFPDQLVYADKENKIKNNIVNYTHEFIIKNLGPSPLLHLTATFYFPTEVASGASKTVFEVYEPKVYVSQQLFQCTTDYPSGFFRETVVEGASDIVEEQAGAVLSRLRRSSGTNTPRFEHLVASESPFDLPMNRTMFINCTSNEFKCMKVVCNSTQMMNRNQYLTAKINFRAHVDILQNITKNKDIVLVSSIGEINFDDKTFSNSIGTLLIGFLSKEEVSYWIYIVSVIAALLILVLLILGLYKLNFFNRPVREKLQNEAEDSSVKKELDDDDHDYEDDEENLNQN